jgi:tetratricopeptide (TPR) repeat protein
VVARLETFIQQVRTAEPGSNDDLLMKLAEIDERIPTEWRGNGKILALLGEAYGELEQFEKGVGYYKLALTDERATFPVKAAEQLWNLQARWAVTLAASGKAKEAKRLLDDSEKQLTALMMLLGKTGERVSLLAGIAAQRLSIAADHT